MAEAGATMAAMAKTSAERARTAWARSQVARGEGGGRVSFGKKQAMVVKAWWLPPDLTCTRRSLSMGELCVRRG